MVFQQVVVSSIFQGLKDLQVSVSSDAFVFQGVLSELMELRAHDVSAPFSFRVSMPVFPVDQGIQETSDD
jgi:hypothetical protein